MLTINAKISGRWVTILRPLWQRYPSDGIQKFVVGNMNRYIAGFFIICCSFFVFDHG